MSKRIFVLALAALIFSFLASAQEDHKPSWGQTTAEKLSHFLPAKPSGLIPQTPWGNSNDNKVDLSTGFSTTGSSKLNEYVIARAVQKWWVDDPSFFQQVATAEADRKKSEDQAMQNYQAHQGDLQALQKQVEDLAKKGQYKEMQAVMDKMKAYTPDEAKTKAMDNNIRGLKGTARTLEIHLEANATAANTLDPAAQPVGAVHGHPLYRIVWPGPVKPLSWVNLAVHVGPPGFQNPDTGAWKPNLKCVMVWLRVTSRPDALKSDEALARQVLDAMDFDGLSKLLEH